jgi:hypothetical protein
MFCFPVQENGVPQGSVLSVTLFAIAISGMVSAVVPVSTFIFVDDITIYHNFLSMATVRHLQIAINRLSYWALQKGFTFFSAKP